MSRILSRRDLDFLLYEWLGVEALTARARFAEHSRETFDAFLDVSARIAERDFAPHNRRSDLDEPTFDGERVTVVPEVGAALTAFNETGLLSASMDAEVGGLQLPHVVVRAVLSFDDATGYLVGKEGHGLAYMFHMMNEARIGVGAVALGYTGYLHAVDYARERLQGRPVAAKDPSAPPVPIIEHPEAAGHLAIAWMWLAQLTAADGKEGSFYDGKRLAARYFVTHELPRTGPLLDLLDARDTLLADLDPAHL